MARRIFINRRPVSGPWGGGNMFVAAFCRYAPQFGYEVLLDFSPAADAVLLVEPRSDGYGPGLEDIARIKKEHPGTVIIHRVNECDARKNTDSIDRLLREAGAVSDAAIFVSEWLLEHHRVRGWPGRLAAVVYNGVDSSVFRSMPKFADGRVHLVTHHWSSNRMKGFDVYEELDRWVGGRPDFTFTYIGRELGSFRNARVVPPLQGDDLGAELGRYDVYVSGSRFDPGPNHVLESLSCGLPTYVHSEGGGAVEFAGRDHAFASFNELEALLQARVYVPNNAIELNSWESCIKRYCAVIDAVFDEVKPSRSGSIMENKPSPQIAAQVANPRRLSFAELAPNTHDVQYSQRRYFVDEFFIRQAGSLPQQTRILDMGGKKLRKRGQFDIERFGFSVQYANLDASSGPDYLCDIGSIPVDSGTFDAVILAEVAEHLQEPDAVLREAARVLRPGGVFLATAPYMYRIHPDPVDVARYLPQWWMKHLQSAGFVEAVIEPQGHFFSTMADFLRDWILNLEERQAFWPGTRELALQASDVVRQFALRTEQDSYYENHQFFSGFSTGFGIRAVRG